MRTHTIILSTLMTALLFGPGCATSNPTPQKTGAAATVARSSTSTPDFATPGTPGTPGNPGQMGNSGGGMIQPASLPASPISIFGQIVGASGATASASTTDNLRQITFASEGNDFDPAIDPTGRYIVYASTRHRATADLYLQRTDSNTVTQLTNDPGNDVMPAFAPDGKKVAFCSDRAGSWDIYLIATDVGGAPTQLTNDGAQNIHPSFSPDGKYLVYASKGAQSEQWELVVIEVDKPANKRFLGAGLFPQWSPVENKIVFQRARERGTRLFSVWTMDYVNGEGLRPTEIVASSNAACITPTWSPDGRRIAFCTVVNPDGQERPQQADVWVVNADGSGRANLTRSKAANTQPTWACDGSLYFVCSRSRNASQSVWALKPEHSFNTMETMPAAANMKPAPAGAAADAGH